MLLGYSAFCQDGRLQVGDQLLAINSVPTASKPVSEVAKQLREPARIVKLRTARDIAGEPPQLPKPGDVVRSPSSAFGTFFKGTLSKLDNILCMYLLASGGKTLQAKLCFGVW